MDQTSRLSQGKKCWYPGKGLGQVLLRVVNIVVLSYRRKRRLYIGIFVRVESVLLKAVSSVVNVDVNVDFSATYDWSFSIEFV